MNYLSSCRRLAVLLVSFGAIALMAPAQAPAAHPVPGSAGDPGVPGDGPFRTPLVPIYRQCGTGANPVNGAHAPPMAVGSCLPPALNGPVSVAGPASVGSVTITKVPGGGGPAGDDTVAISITDVQCGPTPSAGCPGPGADYGIPGAMDLYFTARVRLIDHMNCAGVGCVGPYGAAGTTTDFDLPRIVLDCVPVGAPGAPPGSTCAIGTSLNTVTPGFVMPGMAQIIQIFRDRVINAGPDGALGSADDQLFEQQGIFNP
jgi:hypothetical protein